MATEDQTADALLARLLDYLTARRAFEVAVDEARRQGWPDERISGVTGVSPSKVEAMLGRGQDARTRNAARAGRPFAA